MQSFIAASLLTGACSVACSKSSTTKEPRPDPIHDPGLAARLEPPRELAPDQRRHDMHWVDPGVSAPKAVEEALAILEPTRGSAVRGTVRFRETTKGVAIFTSVSGLPPGPHAYHVHLYGDCSAEDATSAGPHFHFHGSSHDKSVAIITGNLGELRATSSELTKHESEVSASLHGPYSLVGRSVIVHEKGNDHGVTPDGAAGARLACGVIGIANLPATDKQPTTAGTQ